MPSVGDTKNIKLMRYCLRVPRLNLVHLTLRAACTTRGSTRFQILCICSEATFCIFTASEKMKCRSEESHGCKKDIDQENSKKMTRKKEHQRMYFFNLWHSLAPKYSYFSDLKPNLAFFRFLQQLSSWESSKSSKANLVSRVFEVK